MLAGQQFARFCCNFDGGHYEFIGLYLDAAARVDCLLWTSALSKLKAVFTNTFLGLVAFNNIYPTHQIMLLFCMKLRSLLSGSNNMITHLWQKKWFFVRLWVSLWYSWCRDGSESSRNLSVSALRTIHLPVPSVSWTYCEVWINMMVWCVWIWSVIRFAIKKLKL